MRLVAKDRDTGISPEFRTVLAHTPSTIDKATLSGSHPKLVVGPSALSYIFRIKYRDVLPYDLVRRVAHDPLSSGVPCRNAAVGVGHIDGVIGDALDEEAKALLA